MASSSSPSSPCSSPSHREFAQPESGTLDFGDLFDFDAGEYTEVGDQFGLDEFLDFKDDNEDDFKRDEQYETREGVQHDFGAGIFQFGGENDFNDGMPQQASAGAGRRYSPKGIMHQTRESMQQNSSTDAQNLHYHINMPNPTAQQPSTGADAKKLLPQDFLNAMRSQQRHPATSPLRQEPGAGAGAGAGVQNPSPKTVRGDFNRVVQAQKMHPAPTPQQQSNAGAKTFSPHYQPGIPHPPSHQQPDADSAAGAIAKIIPFKEVQDIRKHLTAILIKPSLNESEKLKIVRSFPAPVLDDIYLQVKPREGPFLPSPSPPPTSAPRSRSAPSRSVPASEHTLSPPAYYASEPGLTEANYLPLIEHDESSTDPSAPAPLYPAYAGHFQSAEHARRHRKRSRMPPKSGAPDVDRVKRYGRQYWVQQIYEAMIDISDISDGDASIHRQRFAVAQIFDPMDLEATAHHIFDAALAVHERGWNRPSVYHKKVVRGKLTDVSEKSVETRLARICICLRQRKATVDDAIRGGVTLALLCDNPEARGFTKASNNSGNRKRGERLKLVKDQMALQEPGQDLDGSE